MEPEKPAEHADAVRRVHVEVHQSNRAEGPIRVICECPIDADHTYADWFERYGHRPVRGRAARTTPPGPMVAAQPNQTPLDLHVERMLARHRAPE